MNNKKYWLLLIIIVAFLSYYLANNYFNTFKTNKIINEISNEDLNKDNSNLIGWLTVKNTNINYPVVQSDDNKYYLNHDLNNNQNKAGWIFQDYRSNKELTTKNTIIYGHARISDGTMFGSLYNILNKSWYTNQDNHIITYKIKSKTNYYQVFSTYIIPKETYYLKTAFNNDNAYLNYLNEIKSRSYYNYNVELYSTDFILTLTTCYQNNQRLVLHAKLL